MSKPKLLFVYDHKYPDKWMDGLWAALTILEKDFDLRKINIAEEHYLPEFHLYDFVLGWGGFNSKVDNLMQLKPTVQGDKDNIKMGLCIGGNAFPPAGADNYDVLFYETKWYRPQISFHKNIVHAFGVNTDIYGPIEFPVPVVWDYIGVGSFSSWKRWEKMKLKQGNRLVIGEMQEDNRPESTQIANDLLYSNVMVSNMLSAYDLANLYHWSRVAYIPASITGGGERAVLEARSCGLTVMVEDDNPKLQELLTSPIYDHNYYASQLKKGILSVI